MEQQTISVDRVDADRVIVTVCHKFKSGGVTGSSIVVPMDQIGHLVALLQKIKAAA